ncbi:hypothetical protein FQR65_LT02883 [Abscondita terminalis]|nr:hypothetical protein FQR65_LT02883 [Abscondita terminalis]
MANEDFLTFDYSYGYDCKRIYNLVVLDEITLLFASGNFLHFFNVNTRKLSFRRSEFDNGIVLFQKNPSAEYSHFAVGESSDVIIYEWTSLKKVNLIRCNAKGSVISLTYNLNGKLLLSHTGAPDYCCFVLDWLTATVLFKSSSKTAIHRVQFSSYHHNRFTCFGPDSIKFWMISQTFTGLKVQGQEGKFDQTNTSSILCTYHMPDDTILSGSEWGNILVWKDSYINFEIERKMKKYCHDAPITQFFFEDDELWTVSMDGHIKLWYYNKINSTKLDHDHRFVSVEPIYKFSMPGIMFFGIHKEPISNFHFAQDGNGGLWQIYLDMKEDEREPVQLYKCHGGAVVDIITWGNYLLSLGVDGRLQLYNYVKREFSYSYQFPAKGCCLLWLSVQPSGNQFIAGFDDGNLRVVVIELETEMVCTSIQILKSHTLALTKIALNEDSKVLVSASEDFTIFVYLLNCSESDYATVIPIGYVQLLEIPKCLIWSTHCCDSIVVGGDNGYYAHVNLPNEVQGYTEHTYLLEERPRKYVLQFLFTSAISLGYNETKRDLTNNILWILAVNGDTWFSMDACDAGFIYKFNKRSFKTHRTSAASYTTPTESQSITAFLVFLALGDGSVIIANQYDFSDNHRISLHDNRNSFIPAMCFSHDKKYFFTCGYDGNIFSFISHVVTDQPILNAIKPLNPPIKVNDSNGYSNLSLEQVKTKNQIDEHLKATELKKRELTDRLLELRKNFENAMKRNEVLPESQKLTKEELEMHPLITKYFDNELTKQLELVKAQLAHKVEKSKIILEKVKNRFTDPLDFFPIRVDGIQNGVSVSVIIQNKLTEEFYGVLRKVEEKMKEHELSAMRKRSNRKRDVLLNLSQDLKYGRKINQLLSRYRSRKLKLQKRKKEWDAFKAIKPHKIHSTEDQEALSSALTSIGDYKLKSSPNYIVVKTSQATVLKKYSQILNARLKKFTIIHEYNEKIYQIRTKRVKVVKQLQILINELEIIHEDLNEEHKKFAPSISLREEEFPEKNLEVVVTLPEVKKTNGVMQMFSEDLIEKEVLIKNTDVEEDTDWEIEARNYREWCKVFEQDALLKKIHLHINTFDDEIEHLAKKGNEIARDVDLLDLRIITLNQELIILKQFETRKTLETVKKLRAEGNGLKVKFLTSIEESVHKQYLKSIFNGHEEMEMFSSSESSGESEYSENLDEHEQELYQIAVNLRQRRAAIHRDMEILKNRVDFLNNEIKSKHARSKKIEREIKLLRCSFDQLQKKPLFKQFSRVYSTHLCRMKTDCHLMKDQIKKLQSDIEDNLKKKIGMVVKIDVIEEVRLKQKLFEFELSRTNVKSSFEKEIKKWNGILKTKRTELKEVINDNSSKMNVLAALHKEKADLMEILYKQTRKHNHIDSVVVVADKCKENIEKLSSIVQNQNQELEVLKNEIKRLSYKTLPSRTSAKMSEDLFSINLDYDSSRRESFKFKVWDNKVKQEFVAEKRLIFQPPLITEVQIPAVLSDEIEEVVQGILLEMLESLGNLSETFKTEAALIVQQIMPNLVAQNNIEDMIRELTNFLPKDFTIIEQDIIKFAAHKILLLLHPELKLRNIEDSAKELLIEVIEEMVHVKGELPTLVENLLLRLVQCLPIKFLIQKETINIFVTKLEDLLQTNEESILEAVLKVSEKCSVNLQEIVEKIIEYISKH